MTKTEQRRAMLCATAKSFLGEREQQPNRSPLIDRWNREIGAPLGSSYCLTFLQWCVARVDDLAQAAGIATKRSALPRLSGCVQLWERAPEALRQPAPLPGCLVLWQKNGTWMGHAGLVLDVRVDRMTTLEANTSGGTGLERDGDGIYLRDRSVFGSDAFKVLGFLSPWEEE